MNFSDSIVVGTICFLMLIGIWTSSLNDPDADEKRQLFERCLGTFIIVSLFIVILGGDLFQGVHHLAIGNKFLRLPIIISTVLGILLAIVLGFLSYKYEIGKSYTIGYTILVVAQVGIFD